MKLLLTSVELSLSARCQLNTVIGRIGGRVLMTMVERKSRYRKVLLGESKEARKPISKKVRRKTTT